MKNRSVYNNPLISRYASREMSAIFSDESKFKNWRQCWIALAEAQKELGLPITDEQIEELKAFQDKINYELMDEKERELRHDVMAAVLAYGEQCAKARGILHLGATSCFVTDNTELMQANEALGLIERRLQNVISASAQAADK